MCEKQTKTYNLAPSPEHNYKFIIGNINISKVCKNDLQLLKSKQLKMFHVSTFTWQMTRLKNAQQFLKVLLREIMRRTTTTRGLPITGSHRFVSRAVAETVRWGWPDREGDGEPDELKAEKKVEIFKLFLKNLWIYF